MKSVKYDLGRGILTVGKPELSGSGCSRSWIRWDEFQFKPESSSVLDQGGQAHIDHTFCAGPEDDSVRHRIGHYHEGYDERCSCCWLGFCVF